MSQTETVHLEELVAAHLEGESPDVPEGLRADFEQAVAAHAALRGLIDGLQARGASPIEDSGAAQRLSDLALSPDLELAEAARKAAAFFAGPTKAL